MVELHKQVMYIPPIVVQDAPMLFDLVLWVQGKMLDCKMVQYQLQLDVPCCTRKRLRACKRSRL